MSYDLIAAVLNRPKMYTAKGSFFETIAFLDGYFSGWSLASEGIRAAGIWGDFSYWLMTQVNGESMREAFIKFEAMYLDLAIQELQATYRVFHEQYQASHPHREGTSPPDL